MECCCCCFFVDAFLSNRVSWQSTCVQFGPEPPNVELGCGTTRTGQLLYLLVHPLARVTCVTGTHASYQEGSWPRIIVKFECMSCRQPFSRSSRQNRETHQTRPRQLFSNRAGRHHPRWSLRSFTANSANGYVTADDPARESPGELGAAPAAGNEGRKGQYEKKQEQNEEPGTARRDRKGHVMKRNGAQMHKAWRSPAHKASSAADMLMAHSWDSSLSAVLRILTRPSSALKQAVNSTVSSLLVMISVIISRTSLHVSALTPPSQWHTWTIAASALCFQIWPLTCMS